MSITKSVIFTILFIVTLTITSLLLFFEENIFQLRVSFLINSILHFLIIIGFLKLYKKGKYFVFNSVSWKFLLTASLLGFIYPFFQSILKIIYFFEINENFFNLKLDLLEFSVASISTCIIVPIKEEMFFRGFLLKGLFNKYNKPFLVILITSILFGSIHLNFLAFFFNTMEFRLHHMYLATIGGIIAGVIYYKSDSVWSSIVFHVFWNTSAELITSGA